ncbi:hypothetical protein ARMGADRAFT_771165 [Armillaria gallica]|uniref:Uncharacterized protein n=1 Tax=Armillaria gallica TaxID=47427 RepID=A0A2H3CIY5_ARMGA|nr:hypothetical protein ARMGADRAFT_771165 [Armillaria gallica]
MVFSPSPLVHAGASICTLIEDVASYGGIRWLDYHASHVDTRYTLACTPKYNSEEGTAFRHLRMVCGPKIPASFIQFAHFGVFHCGKKDILKRPRFMQPIQCMIAGDHKR